MISSDRLELIRARAKRPDQTPPPKPRGLHRARHPKLPPKKVRKWIPTKPEYPPFAGDVFGEVEVGSPKRPDWVYMPDKKRKVHCAIKRKARVSPLTRISEQLPMKLRKKVLL